MMDRVILSTMRTHIVATHCTHTLGLVGPGIARSRERWIVARVATEGASGAGSAYVVVIHIHGSGCTPAASTARRILGAVAPRDVVTLGAGFGALH